MIILLLFCIEIDLSASLLSEIVLLLAEDAAGDGDSLDAYMSTMKHSMDNSTKLKIRRKLVELKKVITVFF